MIQARPAAMMKIPKTKKNVELFIRLLLSEFG
jgi:hypothetical protein